jgi:hypothetical protein
MECNETKLNFKGTEWYIRFNIVVLGRKVHSTETVRALSNASFCRETQVSRLLNLPSLATNCLSP